MTEMEQRKKSVMEYLSSRKELTATYKIASACSMNINTAYDVLDVLLKEKKIKKITFPPNSTKKPLATYWEVKG